MKKQAIVWDLDNTLYRETPELHALLDRLTAEAAIEDFHLPLDIETATKMVNESYKIYRDGGKIFIQKYGINQKAMYDAYHKRKEVNLEYVFPYEGLLSELKTLSLPQYVFSASSQSACDALLRKLGLFEFFAGKVYSVEDFNCYKKNENEEVYLKFCEAIGYQPQDCLFVDDSYSNLECAKKAGMNTIRLCHGKPNDKAVEYIDYSCDNIREAIVLLQKLEKI